MQWDLTGPSAFVIKIAEQAEASGISAIIAPKHFPEGLEDAIKEKLALLDLPVIDARQNIPPLAALSYAFKVELKSGRSLPLMAEAEGYVAVVIGINASTLTAWETTLRAYQSGCKERPQYGPIIILKADPDCHETIEQMGIACHVWQDIIGYLDSLQWALQDQKKADPMLGRLAVETAVCLAGWELEEVSRQMIRMDSTKSIFDIPDSNEECDDPIWEQGQIDKFDGVLFKRLALSDRKEISRRIWRAQVTVLFGWLETLREEFIRQNHAWLREATQAGKSSIDISLQEWTEIGRLTRQILPEGDLRRRYSETASEMRNALAHTRIIEYKLYNRLIQCFSKPRAY